MIIVSIDIKAHDKCKHDKWATIYDDKKWIYDYMVGKSYM